LLTLKLHDINVVACYINPLKYGIYLTIKKDWY